MEANSTNINLIPRKSSTSRSNIIENCINLLSEACKSDKIDLDEISTLVINNNLPNELRPIVWKIFLGIFPKDKNLFEWVQIIQNERAIFEKLSHGKEIDAYVRVIRGESEENTIESST